MPTIREILQRREAIRTDLHAIMEKHSDGVLPDDVRQRADELEAEAGRLNDLERRQVLIDEMDRRASGQPLTSSDTSFEQLASQVSILDTMRAQLGGTDAGCGRAREVSRELEHRSGRNAQGLLFPWGQPRRREERVFTTTAPAQGPGSNLIATDVSSSMIDRLRERTVVRALGATVLANLQGNLAIPRLKASASGFWVAENVAVTASDPQTDQVTFAPKTVGGLVEVSRLMIMQPSVDVAAMVEGDLALVLASAIDRAALRGGGSDEPKGILDPTSGINTSSMTYQMLGWPDVVAMISEIDGSNALAGSLAFVTHPGVVKTLRITLKSSADTSSNFVVGDNPATLAGYPLAATTNMLAVQAVSEPDTYALIFADWSQLCIALWGAGLDVLVNPYDAAAYPKGNVMVRAMSTCDIGIRQPKAFSARTEVAVAA